MMKKVTINQEQVLITFIRINSSKVTKGRSLSQILLIQMLPLSWAPLDKLAFVTADNVG